MLIAQHIEGKNGHNQSGNHGNNVQNAAQPLPALPLRVEKYLFIGHGQSRLFYVLENRENGQRYTVRIVWKPRKRVNWRPCVGFAPVRSSLPAVLVLTPGLMLRL
jgi:hypothetical protein